MFTGIDIEYSRRDIFACLCILKVLVIFLDYYLICLFHFIESLQKKLSFLRRRESYLYQRIGK